MSHYSQPEARLYHFLRDVYGDLPPMTRIDVDVDALSGGFHGTPHLEATEIRVYSMDDEQLLPDFEMPFWKGILAAHPDLSRACTTTHQDRLDTVQELLVSEHLYQEYRLDWPDVREKVITPLSFTIVKLRQVAREETAGAEGSLEEDEEEGLSAEDLLKKTSSA